MRKTLLALFFASLISIGWAQPVLDQSSIGAIGSVYYMGGQDTLLPVSDVGPAGANQTWNFHALVATQVDTIRYVDPLATAFAADFPSSNLAIQQSSLNNGTGYVKSTPTDMQLQGFAGDILNTGTPIVAYQNPALVVSQFPFTYQDAFNHTSTLDVTIDASGFGIPLVDSARFKNIQVRNVMADGYGTLLLPAATYNNVLRIKEVNMQTDSTWIHTFFGWQLFSDSVYTDSTFNWSDNTSGYVLAQAEYVGGVLDNIRTQDFVLVGRSEPLVAGYEVYPNPAQNRIVVKGDGSLAEIQIMDLQGRVMMTQALTNAQAELNVGNLARGCYIYSLLDAEGIPAQTGKLLLTH